MLAHLIEVLRMSTGDLKVAPGGNWAFRHFPVKQMILYGPWPKGAPTAPEVLARAPGDLEADRAEFKRCVERCGTFQGIRPEHPALGFLGEEEWGHLMYKHIDHHLRQFSI